MASVGRVTVSCGCDVLSCIPHFPATGGIRLSSAHHRTAFANAHLLSTLSLSQTAEERAAAAEAEAAAAAAAEAEAKAAAAAAAKAKAPAPLFGGFFMPKPAEPEPVRTVV